jgi:DNA-binding MarR family transcriptional regulator
METNKAIRYTARPEHRKGQSSVAGLEAHLGYWLRFVSNHVSHTFSGKLEGRSVSVGEWVTLRELYDADGIAPIRLAERLGMTRGAISKIAERLIAKSLAKRKPDPNDGRGQFLTLTAAGRRLVPVLAALADQNDAEFFGHLSMEDREKVMHVLKEIVERRGLKSVPVD